ncbi:hypothetical protein RFI_26754, partial [Reticulomyxa filosa]
MGSCVSILHPVDDTDAEKNVIKKPKSTTGKPNRDKFTKPGLARVNSSTANRSSKTGTTEDIQYNGGNIQIIDEMADESEMSHHNEIVSVHARNNVSTTKIANGMLSNMGVGKASITLWESEQVLDAANVGDQENKEMGIEPIDTDTIDEPDLFYFSEELLEFSTFWK